jgi:hypothetical protein
MKLPKFNLKINKIPEVKIYGIDVIKNFIFFTLFIILTLVTIAFVIAPSIRIFKKYQEKYYKAKTNFNLLDKEFIKKQKELNKIKLENKKIIYALKRDFNKNNFIEFASKFMSVKKIKEINYSVYNNDFIKTSYFVNVKINSPEDFYKFVDSLKNYKYVLRVDFPIKFEKDENRILLSFTIDHFKVKR